MAIEPTAEPLSHSDTAEGTGDDTDQGDTDLDGGEGSAWIVDKVRRSASTLATWIRIQPQPP